MGRKRHALGAPGEETVYESSGDPLLLALFQGDGEGAKQLIEAGADVQATDHMGWTPLHRACFAGLAEVTGLLIRLRADPSAADNDGLQPLHVAAAGEHLECCRHLLAARADPRVPDAYGGMSAQMHALSKEGDEGTALRALLGEPSLSLFAAWDDPLAVARHLADAPEDEARQVEEWLQRPQLQWKVVPGGGDQSEDEVD